MGEKKSERVLVSLEEETRARVAAVQAKMPGEPPLAQVLRYLLKEGLAVAEPELGITKAKRKGVVR